MFWPDLASCHYTKENLAFLEENGIAYVKKEENPPSAPQIRPIENYWGILKMKVQDQDIVIKMFENLKTKVHMANENGLTSLLKT